MKTLQITTRRKAEQASIQTLFNPIGGKTATRKMRYDRGKYAVGPNLVGQTIEVSDDVAAIFVKRQRDKDGPYQALWCYTTTDSVPAIINH